MCLLCSVPAAAQTSGYASGFDVSTAQDSLYRINLESGVATRIGPLGFLDVEGLAVHPDGTLYGAVDGTSVQGGGSDLLIRINTETGAGTFAAALSGLAGLGPGLGGQMDYGLAATCDGRLWLSSDTLGHLWEVNRQDGSLRRVVQAGPKLSGLAASGNFLYGLALDTEESLYRIDTQTLAVTRIGGLGLPSRIYDAGLDFDASGRLWATLDYLTPPDGAQLVLRNDIAELDPLSGAILRRYPITGAGSGLNTTQMEGLAIAPPSCEDRGTPGVGSAPKPVPLDSPLALLLAALALGGVGMLRLARR
jgi:hypothetical protein